MVRKATFCPGVSVFPEFYFIGANVLILILFNSGYYPELGKPIRSHSNTMQNQYRTSTCSYQFPTPLQVFSWKFPFV